MSGGRCVVAVAVVCVLTAGGGVFGETIDVPGDYPTIQGAIDAAVDGDEICVRPPREFSLDPHAYNEAIDFLGKAVRLYAYRGLRPPYAEVRIDGTGLNTSVVRCVNGEGSDTILEGFVITGGGDDWRDGGMLNAVSSPTVVDCTFIRNLRTGMFNQNSNPTVMRCIFANNGSSEDPRGYGAGMNNENSSPSVVECTFLENHAVAGGGMHNESSSPTVMNCTFRGNTAQRGDGNIGGGGMLNLGSSPTVLNCDFIGNNAGHGGSGGGMQNAGGRPTVTNCRFIGNSAPERTGGGMSNSYWLYGCSGSSPVVTNCTFIGNTARYGGGMAAQCGSGPTVTNCSFVGNTADEGGAVSSPGNFVNSIFWNNSGGQIVGNVAVEYSDVQGGYDGIGNIDLDPLCDADGRPRAGSPCIDAGVNNAVPTDTLDLDNDGDMSERIPIDLDGNHRFMDDGATEDTGCGPVVVDMGAYEFLGEPMHPVLIGDIDGDGVVDFADLLDVLAAWGTCDVDCCLADQDFNWVVDVREILMVLGRWG